MNRLLRFFDKFCFLQTMPYGLHCVFLTQHHLEQVTNCRLHLPPWVSLLTWNLSKLFLLECFLYTLILITWRASGYFCSCCVRLVTLTTFVLSRSRTATVGFAASTTTSCNTFSSLSVFVSNQPHPHPSPIKLSVYLNVTEGLLHPILVFQARWWRRSFASSCWRFHLRWWTTRHSHYKSDISMLWSKLFVNSFYKFTLPSNTAVVVCLLYVHRLMSHLFDRKSMRFNRELRFCVSSRVSSPHSAPRLLVSSKLICDDIIIFFNPSLLV